MVLSCQLSFLFISFLRAYSAKKVKNVQEQFKNSSRTSYTPGIYADGYIVFAFPFVRSSVHMFVSSFVRSWDLRQGFASKFLKWCISQQLHIRKHSYSDHSYPGGLAFNP